MKTLLACVGMLAFTASMSYAGRQPADYVNPLLGTATLWDKSDLGYTPTPGHRAWGAEVFPGSSLPNAMVQLTPITTFHSGSGYQYEDPAIQGFAHTSKGHWNLGNIPLLPVQGDINPDDFGSPFSHKNESAHPGYYRVFLDRYGVEAELTSTLRCAFHRYTFHDKKNEKLIADLATANEHVRKKGIQQEGYTAFAGFQECGETMYFYAVTNHKITGIETLKSAKKEISVVDFADSPDPLELQIGFSFVSVNNARENLKKEMLGKRFSRVRKEATQTWNGLLSRIKISGGTDRQRGIFYSCLYRSFLWPALRSDSNGEYVDRDGKVVNKGFNYYTEPSLWDDYRNKLVLLGMLTPQVSVDVIKSLIDRGEKTGFMPTFFHGDHAAAYIAGSYLRGIRGYDIKSAYNLLLRNATVEGGTRPYINEYMEKGYISDPDIKKPEVWSKAKAGVTKTLEYAYDDYAVALLAKELGDTANYDMLMKRTSNYKNVFDPSTQFMRGRLENGDWITPFDPKYPYYEYMYREANAYQSSFFAPHDVNGLIGLYGGKDNFEKKLDDLFKIPWNGVGAMNLTVFIGQYCHGNQPDHSYPFLYEFVGKPEKSQAILDRIMENFYDMGKDHLAYAGMDDAGEMSSWYVFSAIGIYPFSPADEDYVISAPLFDKVKVRMGDGAEFTIEKKNAGRKITGITYDRRKLDSFFISHHALIKGKVLAIWTE